MSKINCEYSVSEIHFEEMFEAKSGPLCQLNQKCQPTGSQKSLCTGNMLDVSLDLHEKVARGKEKGAFTTFISKAVVKKD